MDRISRTEMYMQIARLMARRGTCGRLQVGCIVTKGGRTVSSGYCGSPSGTPHCLDEGCIIGPDGGCIRTAHAEAGAISYAARNGVSLEGATMWCTHSPCLTCAKLIINAGISRLVYGEEYRDSSGLDLLLTAGVEVDHYVSTQMELFVDSEFSR